MSETDGTTQPAVGPETAPAVLDLGAAIGAPDFILPWLDRMYDADDVALVLAAATGDLSGAAPKRLERAYRRAILDRDENGAYAPADLHERLEIWAMFEGWKDVPLAVHRRLAEWDVGYYADTIRSNVEAAVEGHPGESYEARYAYILLHEAEAIIAAQDHIYLFPCDCRSIVSRCRKPTDVCLRFENDRGLGWEISRERASTILRSTDKAGLMHTADVHAELADTSSICNCCTDCCYPHLASERLGVGDAWPIRRHVAAIDRELCTSCGRCGLRCPFEAIVCTTSGRPELTAALCRGCGLCQTGCSSDAITLGPLSGE